MLASRLSACTCVGTASVLHCTVQGKAGGCLLLRSCRHVSLCFSDPFLCFLGAERLVQVPLVSRLDFLPTSRLVRRPLILGMALGRRAGRVLELGPTHCSKLGFQHDTCYTEPAGFTMRLPSLANIDFTDGLRTRVAHLVQATSGAFSHLRLH